MTPYQILYKNDVVICVDLLDESSSIEVRTLSDQGFTLHEEIIEAKSKDVAKSVYLAQKPKPAAKYKKIALATIAGLTLLFGAGYVKGLEFQNTEACQNLASNQFAAMLAASILPSIIDNMSETSAIPIYRQGLSAGIKHSIGACVR